MTDTAKNTNPTLPRSAATGEPVTLEEANGVDVDVGPGPHLHDGEPRPLPWYTGAMVTTHLVLTRDRAQHRAWTERIDQVRQQETIERTPDLESRKALRNLSVWRSVRRVGTVGAVFNLVLAIPWLVSLIPTYAIGHGFGWLAALSFLLPVPLAYKIGRRFFEEASVDGLSLANDDSALGSLRRICHAGFRTFASGFAFAFTLLFLQGLISWFMTPAPTLAAELFIDGMFATYGGVVFGTLSMMLAPLVTAVTQTARRESALASATSGAVGSAVSSRHHEVPNEDEVDAEEVEVVEEAPATVTSR